MTTILPTHTCFDDALDYIWFRLTLRRQDEPILTLVHAICLAPEGPSAGERFAHAWVEERQDDGFIAWQDGFLAGQRVTYSTPASELREALRVQFHREYTVQQASALNRATGTYGPWHHLIRELCGPGRVFRPEDA